MNLAVKFAIGSPRPATPWRARTACFLLVCATLHIESVAMGRFAGLLCMIYSAWVTATVPIEVGFCDANGQNFEPVQPADQLERWQLPYDNGTHLVIHWRPDRRLNGRNVTTYQVDVRTSLPVLNLFVGAFGGFPQDLCGALYDPSLAHVFVGLSPLNHRALMSHTAPDGSKARDAVSVTETGEGATCSPYSNYASSVQRLTAFEIPEALRRIASWDVTVTVRGYGSHAPLGRPEEAVPATFWCHGYRRRKQGPSPPSESASASTPFAKPDVTPLEKVRQAVAVGWRRLTSRRNR